MKKLFITLLVLLNIGFFAKLSAQAEVFDYVSGVFDWLYLSNTERHERVTTIFQIMFPKGYVTNFPRGFLKDRLKEYLKDKNYKIHYEAVCSGYTSYKDVKLQPFFLGKSKYVYMYALQYSSDQQKTFYYDAMGRLKFVDFRYGDFPNFPYYTKKYSLKGKLIRAMYLANPETMYLYNNKGTFIGVRYQNSIYGLNNRSK